MRNLFTTPIMLMENNMKKTFHHGCVEDGKTFDTEDGGSKGSAGKEDVCLGSVIALDNHYTMMKKDSDQGRGIHP